MIYLKGEQWGAVLEYKTWQVGDGENKFWLWKSACARIKIREDEVINAIQNANIFFQNDWPQVTWCNYRVSLLSYRNSLHLWRPGGMAEVRVRYGLLQVVFPLKKEKFTMCIILFCRSFLPVFCLEPDTEC